MDACRFTKYIMFYSLPCQGIRGVMHERGYSRDHEQIDVGLLLF